MNILEKIKKKEACIGIFGLGYVGLPLAVEFAQEGFKVIGFDVSEDKCAKLNDGQSYIEDISSDELSKVTSSGLLKATSDFSHLKEVDCISICVPTPLVKTRDPDMSYIMAACEQIQQYLRKDCLIVLESTTYPGTTEEIMVPAVEEKGFTVGRDVFVAFSPERIDPGNQTYQLRNTPKVIGGITKNCQEVATALYSNIVDKVVPVSSAKAAEMVKLLENTFRSVNIGLANEVAQMCHILGLDTNEVIEAAATKPFGFTPFYPGPGLGGHCIPIDPHYLSWKLKTLNYQTRFIDLASEINTAMPDFVVGLATDQLNDMKKSVNGARIMVIGAAYKKNVSDMRESPSLDILRLFHAKGGEVSYHDPFVPELKVSGQSLKSTSFTVDELSKQDLLVVATWHDQLDLDTLLKSEVAIIDTRNATRGIDRDRLIRI